MRGGRRRRERDGEGMRKQESVRGSESQSGVDTIECAVDLLHGRSLTAIIASVHCDSYK